MFFLFLALRPSCSMERNSLSNFGKKLPVKLFQNLSTDLAEVIYSFFLFIVLLPFCSTERNHLSNFGRGLAKEHFCVIISKSVHPFSRSHLKVFLYIALATILFNRAEWFEQFW